VPHSAISFVHDDGTSENSVGYGSGTVENAALWLNRFTPPADTFPLSLDTISIYWPAASQNITVGLQMRLLVYLDADGNADPRNATLLYQQLVTVGQLSAFQNYPVNVIVPGPGDIYLGFEDYFAEAGHTPKGYPAALDTTAPHRGRSWVVGKASGAAPDVNNLANNEVVNTIDNLGLPGDWLIRASGQTNITPTPTSTSTSTPTQTSTPTSTA
jgi:hypothetical protein